MPGIAIDHTCEKFRGWGALGSYTTNMDNLKMDSKLLCLMVKNSHDGYENVSNSFARI